MEMAVHGAREARARRALARQGCLLRKDRAKSWSLDHQGAYMVVLADANLVLLGAHFDWTLADVEEWLAAPMQRK